MFSVRLRATITWTSSERLALFVPGSDRLRAPGGGRGVVVFTAAARVGLVIVGGRQLRRARAMEWRAAGSSWLCADRPAWRPGSAVENTVLLLSVAG
jgi:hypothetical protein